MSTFLWLRGLCMSVLHVHLLNQHARQSASVVNCTKILLNSLLFFVLGDGEAVRANNISNSSADNLFLPYSTRRQAGGRALFFPLSLPLTCCPRLSLFPVVFGACCASVWESSLPPLVSISRLLFRFFNEKKTYLQLYDDFKATTWRRGRGSSVGRRG